MSEVRTRGTTPVRILFTFGDSLSAVNLISGDNDLIQGESGTPTGGNLSTISLNLGTLAQGL